MIPRGFEDARGETTLDADVVVVGTGPGGAALGRTLARGGLRVVLLEEGPALPRFRPNQAHTSRYHMQENGMMVAAGTGMMPIAAGRGVGGGSLVNSAICFRTPDAVLDGWEAVLGGDARFASRALAPIYDALEALLGVGRTPDAIAGENNHLIVRGARKLGLHADLVHRNTPGCAGCGICNFGCPSGGKASVDRNLLPEAVRHGAVIQADTKVDAVLVAGGRAVGVAGDVMHPDTREVVGRLTVRAERVVVSAGAVGTPRLLHHAGLADRLGPRLGKGLHVHPGSAVLGWCPHEVRMWKGATQGAYFEDPALPGVLPHTLSGPPGVLLLSTGATGAEAKAMLARLAHLCGCLVMVSDRGEGEVGAKADGRANLRYDFDPADVDLIKRGLVRTAEVLIAGGATEIFSPIHGVGTYTDVGAYADALARTAIQDFTLYAAHPMSTCRMGADPASSVIGADGQAHGLPGLFIADSSVFPTSLGVNPQLTTMAVATRIAQGMLAD